MSTGIRERQRKGQKGLSPKNTACGDHSGGEGSGRGWESGGGSFAFQIRQPELDLKMLRWKKSNFITVVL